jgi:Protein tyrosine and serine/threonine kinase
VLCVVDGSFLQVGTLIYMGPENLSGGHYNRSVDVYSFGVMLWELWYRRSPFARIKMFRLYEAVVEENVRPDCFDDDLLTQLCRMCWDANPKVRPTFPQILDMLAEVRNQLPRILKARKAREAKAKAEQRKERKTTRNKRSSRSDVQRISNSKGAGSAASSSPTSSSSSTSSASSSSSSYRSSDGKHRSSDGEKYRSSDGEKYRSSDGGKYRSSDGEKHHSSDGGKYKGGKSSQGAAGFRLAAS